MSKHRKGCLNKKASDGFGATNLEEQVFFTSSGFPAHNLEERQTLYTLTILLNPLS